MLSFILNFYIQVTLLTSLMESLEAWRFSSIKILILWMLWALSSSLWHLSCFHLYKSPSHLYHVSMLLILYFLRYRRYPSPISIDLILWSLRCLHRHSPIFTELDPSSHFLAMPNQPIYLVILMNITYKLDISTCLT